MKKYDVILADPPWHYRNYSTKAGKTHNRQRGAAKYYPTMEIDDICQLPIRELCSENAVLFMWAVWPLMPEAFRVITEWGFDYVTNAFVWVKSNKSGFGHYMGMGNYTRGNTEPCLLAVKGKMPVADHSIHQIIYAPVSQHSKKPNDQYRKIEALYPNTNKLELFARRPYPGWDVWGNEVQSDITGLPSNYACNGQAKRPEF